MGLTPPASARALYIRIGAAVAVLLALGIAVWVLASSRPQPRAKAIVQPPSPSATAVPASSSPQPAPSGAPSPAGCPAPPAGGFPGTSIAAAYPTALAWSADGRLFWAERGGTIRVFQGGAAQAFASVNTVTVERGGGYSERGLLGLAISGSSVYAFFSNPDYATQSIVRWTDCGGVARDKTVIASDLPSGSDCCHKGGRLAISPVDGALFATIGDNHVSTAAQVAGDLRGKVIRWGADGGPRSIWTSGLRNPFGIAFAPDGTLALTNNGPSGDAGTPCGACGDEFYMVGRAAGLDYQWPYCWGYSHPIGGGGCHGLPGPTYSAEGGPYPRSSPFFTAPTGVTWSTRAFAGHFVFCAYGTGQLYEALGQGSVAATGIGGCSLDVKQGPDGALYLSSETAITRH